jgi:hypothetical protein
MRIFILEFFRRFKRKELTTRRTLTAAPFIASEIIRGWQSGQSHKLSLTCFVSQIASRETTSSTAGHASVISFKSNLRQLPVSTTKRGDRMGMNCYHLQREVGQLISLKNRTAITRVQEDGKSLCPTIPQRSSLKAKCSPVNDETIHFCLHCSHYLSHSFSFSPTLSGKRILFSYFLHYWFSE